MQTRNSPGVAVGQQLLASRRSPAIAALLLVALLAIFVLSLTWGSVPISADRLWLALIGQGSASDRIILWQLRLPRAVTGATVGAALGISGSVLQGILRNSLANPYLLGISAGAGLVAVAMVALGSLQPWIPLGAWIGAILTATLVWGLARRPDGVAVERLVLAGVAVSSLFGAIQTVLLLLSDDGRIQQALNWIVGSLNGRGWAELQIAAPYMLVAAIAACWLARYLNVLALGDEMATGLGVSLERSRFLLVGSATLLAASAVSIAGLIGFVGLIVPHGVRLLLKSGDYRAVVPLSALGGALVLMLADWVSRLGAVELPVGAVTALLGSPAFIALLYRRSL
ncbi:MAG: iron ABC transporter permease [Cyanobacteria bacterium J06641_5]